MLSLQFFDGCMVWFQTTNLNTNRLNTCNTSCTFTHADSLALICADLEYIYKSWIIYYIDKLYSCVTQLTKQNTFVVRFCTRDINIPAPWRRWFLLVTAQWSFPGWSIWDIYARSYSRHLPAPFNAADSSWLMHLFSFGVSAGLSPFSSSKFGWTLFSISVSASKIELRKNVLIENAKTDESGYQLILEI